MRSLTRPVLVSLLLVYFVWGSTYLVMRFAVAGLPPMMMGGTRFLIAGTILLGWLKLRGAPWPTAREWLASAPIGMLLFLLGNGCVGIAEQKISSGIAAVVCGTTPLVAAALGPFFGQRATVREWLGMGVGLVGVVLLSLGGELRGEPLAALILLAAPLSWGLGSLLSHRLPLPKGALSAATEMLTGGAAMLVFGLLRGEVWPAHPDPRSLASLAYLVVFGSLVGFTAFNHLLRTTRPSVALSYSYVNPAVAVLLSALFDSHPLTLQVAVATLLIAGSTAVTILGRPAPAGGRGRTEGARAPAGEGGSLNASELLPGAAHSAGAGGGLGARSTS